MRSKEGHETWVQVVLILCDGAEILILGNFFFFFGNFALFKFKKVVIRFLTMVRP